MTVDTVPVVAVRMPDPATLSWEERAEMRIVEAHRYRWQHSTWKRSNHDGVGVDILPLEG